jgi:hypothetical protein
MHTLSGPRLGPDTTSCLITARWRVTFVDTSHIDLLATVFPYFCDSIPGATPNAHSLLSDMG